MLGFATEDVPLYAQFADEIIGKGATAVVRRLAHPYSDLVMKSFIPQALSQTDIRREILVHKHLSSPSKRHCNLIGFTSAFQSPHDSCWHIVMERAEHGELFERIEPDIGFPENAALLYFRQLLSAVAYMHCEGICHRDIKPENILLGTKGILKLSDFGLATLYKRKQGERRLLKSQCGTRMYVAPEILSGHEYDGEAIDVWSMGIVLYVMLTGDVPWNEATVRSPDYMRFQSNLDFDNLTISSDAHDLLLSMLQPDPKKRISLKEIEQHQWLNNESVARNSLSNPEQVNCTTAQLAPFHLSQPAKPSDINEIVGTRIKLEKSTEALSIISSALQDLFVEVKETSDKRIVFATTDKRNNALIGLISLQNDELIFQKRRGDWIEFKRLFAIIASNFMSQIPQN